MTQRSENAPDPLGPGTTKPPPVTASLAGRGSWCLSAGAQIAPAATANKGAKTMKRTAARWYPVLLLRNALGRFMSLRVPQVRKPRHRRVNRRATPGVQLALF
jgi:hypothetical protein